MWATRELRFVYRKVIWHFELLCCLLSVMKLGWNESYYDFTESGVAGYAPSACGLYALFSQDRERCFIVNASTDLRQDLAAGAGSALPSPDRTQTVAKWYQFEVVPESRIPARLAEARSELHPTSERR